MLEIYIRICLKRANTNEKNMGNNTEKICLKRTKKKKKEGVHERIQKTNPAIC